MTAPLRVGLVLGAGGYPGWPFHLTVLAAAERHLGMDLRDAELVLGTSVGSMVAMLLRAGFSVQDMLAHAEGRTMSDEGEHLLHRVMDPPGALPPAFPSWQLPRARPTGAPMAWWAMAGQGRRRNWVPGLASTLLPRGTTDHGVFARAADSLLPAWPERDTWVVAMRARDGRRRVFGRGAATAPGLAVTASSSIPGYFAPIEIDGDAHVDAGVLSTTHADLLVDRDDLDLVLVVPPLASAGRLPLTIDGPLRLLVNGQVRDEVATLRDAGHAVALLAPPPDVVRAMQGDPIRMRRERLDRALSVTQRWAAGAVGPAIHDAVERRVPRLDRRRAAHAADGDAVRTRRSG